MQNPDPCRQLLLGSVYPACCVHGMIEAGTYTVAFPDYCLASSASSAASLHPSWVIRQLGPAPLTTRHPAQTVSGFLGRSSVFRGPHVKSRGSFASSCGACAAKLRAAVHRTVRATTRPGKASQRQNDGCLQIFSSGYVLRLATLANCRAYVFYRQFPGLCLVSARKNSAHQRRVQSFWRKLDVCRRLPRHSGAKLWPRSELRDALLGFQQDRFGRYSQRLDAF